MRIIRTLVALAAAAALAGCLGATIDDPRELERTWQEARLTIPGKALGAGQANIFGRLGAPDVQRAIAALPPGTQVPLVIYLHGCTGIASAGHAYQALLTALGFAVIMPDSFARAERPETCDPRRRRGIPGAPWRAVYSMRQAEIRHALEQARALSWVDRGNLFLMGHSQGGTATSEFTGTGFRGRIASGTSCWRGIGAAPSEPMLVVYSADDPWFRGAAAGSCRPRAEGRVNVSIVAMPGPVHNVSGFSEVQDAIRRFLREHSDYPR